MGNQKSVRRVPSVPSVLPVPQNRIAGCSNLECLKDIDHMIVYQKIDLHELFSRYEQENSYLVMNNMGQQLFFAKEESGYFLRQFNYNKRRFHMKIMDNSEEEVIHIYRPYNYCFQEMEISCPPGNLIGYVIQDLQMCQPKFRITDRNKETLLNITGPCCATGYTRVFQVTDNSGSPIGEIRKEWSGLYKELFTQADNFGLSFPVDLSVYLKALLLGACFLIDYMYYERKKDENKGFGH